MSGKLRPVLLWDLMGTVVHDPFFVEFIAQLDEPLGLWMKKRDRQAWVDFELGNIKEELFFERLFPMNPQRGLWMKRIFFEGYRLLPGRAELLSRLAAQGVESHVLSNYPEWYQFMKEKLELELYFERFFISCHLGMRKPDPEIYKTVLKELECAPEEVLFIDDRLVNCQAAAQLGMLTIQIRPETQLEQELLSFGL